MITAKIRLLGHPTIHSPLMVEVQSWSVDMFRTGASEGTLLLADTESSAKALLETASWDFATVEMEPQNWSNGGEATVGLPGSSEPNVCWGFITNIEEFSVSFQSWLSVMDSQVVIPNTALAFEGTHAEYPGAFRWPEYQSLSELYGYWDPHILTRTGAQTQILETMIDEGLPEFKNYWRVLLGAEFHHPSKFTPQTRTVVSSNQKPLGEVASSLISGSGDGPLLMARYASGKVRFEMRPVWDLTDKSTFQVIVDTSFDRHLQGFSTPVSLGKAPSFAFASGNKEELPVDPEEVSYSVGYSAGALASSPVVVEGVPVSRESKLFDLGGTTDSNKKDSLLTKLQDLRITSEEVSLTFEGGIPFFSHLWHKSFRVSTVLYGERIGLSMYPTKVSWSRETIEVSGGRQETSLAASSPLERLVRLIK